MCVKKGNNLPARAFVFKFDKYQTHEIDYQIQKNRTIFVNPKNTTD